MNSAFDELEARFGNLYLVVVEQNDKKRVSLTLDNRKTVLSLNIVTYCNVVDREFHSRVLSGEPIGRTAKDMDLEFIRSEKGEYTLTLPSELEDILGGSEVLLKEVEVSIGSELYATIYEIYSSKVKGDLPSEKLSLDLSDLDVAVIKEKIKNA